METNRLPFDKKMKRDLALEAAIAHAMADELPAEAGAELDPNDPRLASFRKIAEALRLQQFEAPAELVAQVKALLPEAGPRRVFAKLIGGSLGLAGARASQAESFQMIFEAEGRKARLMYARDPKGWEVTGQAPAGCQVTRRGKTLPTDPEGRFSFRARKLEETGLTLVENDLEIELPAADRAEEDGTGRAD
jgi:hypothetical protein